MAVLPTAHALALADAELVQSLASPLVLQQLARSGQLADAAFVARLRALHAQWSASPELLCALKYPSALEFLRLAAESAAFRAACAEDAFVAALHADQFGHWSAGSPVTG